MLVSMSDKELKRLSVLQEICDHRLQNKRISEQVFTLTASLAYISCRFLCIFIYRL